MEAILNKIKMWTEGVPVEEEAMQQVRNLTSLPFIFRHVALMPDVHAGHGSTIGSVIATRGAIIPAAVGVDIGCGMMAVKTNLKASQLPDNLFNIRCAIEAAVPHGRTDNGQANDKGAWQEIPLDVQLTYEILSRDLKGWTDRYEFLGKRLPNAHRQLGTLGTGNHFIEICLDEHQDVWVMLHSGSRGIGNSIGTHFIDLAKKDMERWFIHLPDKDLAYIPEGSEYFDDYMDAVRWAQEFARLNRQIMMRKTLSSIQRELGIELSLGMMAINCHHNYVERENHFGKNVLVTRKGAVRAREGELGIIPGSMGAKSFIVKGKGERESFCSCSHGAGRTMSRTKAKAIFTLDDHIKATEGVECRKDIDVIDETPGAYKDIDAVMAAQSDLIDIVHTLKQIVCIKG